MRQTSDWSQHEFVFRGPVWFLWPDPGGARRWLQVPDRPGGSELHVPVWSAPAQAPTAQWHQLWHTRLPLQGLLPLQLTHRLSLSLQASGGVIVVKYLGVYQEIDTKLDINFQSMLAKNLVSVSWYAWLTAKKDEEFVFFLCDCKKWRTQCVAPCVSAVCPVCRGTIREQLSH